MGHPKNCETRIRAYRAWHYVAACTFLASGAGLAGTFGLEPRRVLIAQLVLVSGALIGARVGYRLLGSRRETGTPRTGASLFGAALVAGAVAVPTARLVGVPAALFLDLAVLAGLVAVVPARLGCRARGCCAGNGFRAPLPLVDACCALASASIAFPAGQRFGLAGAAALVGVALYAACRVGLDAGRVGAGERTSVRRNRYLFAGTALVSAALLGLLALAGSSGPPAIFDPALLRLPIELLGAALVLAPVAFLARFVGCGLLLDTVPSFDVGDPVRVVFRISLPPPPDPTTIMGEIRATELGAPGAVTSVFMLMPVTPDGTLLEGEGALGFRQEHVVEATLLREGRRVRRGECTGTPDAAGLRVEFEVDETAPGRLTNTLCFGPRLEFRGGGGFRI